MDCLKDFRKEKMLKAKQSSEVRAKNLMTTESTSFRPSLLYKVTIK